eukprot:164640-Prymnesium_polylepis.1
MEVDLGAWGGSPIAGRWGVVATVICVPIVRTEIARWTRGCNLNQYWGDKVQGDCVVGREILEGSFFGCTGVALAV